MVEKEIDIENLKAISNGDQAFFVEILQLYLERTTQDIEELQKAFDQKDYETIQFIAHRMRSAAVPLGIKNLLIHLKKMELDLKGGKINEVDNDIDRILDLARKALIEVSQELSATSLKDELKLK